MRYDSTYSALIALNKALGGDENKIPDSEYSAVVDLMSTLSGEPIEAATAYEATEQIATMAINRELPIQQTGGCNLGELWISVNGTHYAKDWGLDGIDILHVDVPNNVTPPVIETIEYPDVFSCGSMNVMKLTLDRSYPIQMVNLNFIDANTLMVTYDITAEFSISDIDGKSVIESRITPYVGGQFLVSINLAWFEGVNMSADPILPFEGPLIINCEMNKLTDEGDPSKAIKINTLKEFCELPDSDTQWYEITGRIVNVYNGQKGMFEIADDSLSGDGTNGGTIFINGVNTDGPYAVIDGSISSKLEGDVINAELTILTQKHTLMEDTFFDQAWVNKPAGTVIAGLFNGWNAESGSYVWPVAIFKNIEIPLPQLIDNRWFDASYFPIPDDLSAVKQVTAYEFADGIAAPDDKDLGWVRIKGEIKGIIDSRGLFVLDDGSIESKGVDYFNRWGYNGLIVNGLIDGSKATISGLTWEAADFWNSLSPEVGDTIEFIARPHHISGPLDLSNGEILNEGEMMFIAGCTPDTPYAIYINLEKKTE